MCIPKPTVGAPPPVAAPSLQSAQSIVLGGQERGAAQIGRLQLRLGGLGGAGSSSALTGGAALSTGPTPATFSGAVAQPSTSPTSGSTSQSQVAGYNQANSSLILGNTFVGRQ